jgi:flagellar motility protein MotE (MotC chaperone)
VISSIRMPRLLPATIATIAAVLMAKSTFLVRSAIIDGQPAAFIASAWASAPDTPAPPGNTGDKQAAKPTAKPGAEPPTAVAVPTVAEGPLPMTDSEKAMLLELRERRQELETRETILAGRESMLAAAEKKVSDRVDELQGLQKRLETLDASHRQQENTAWQGLVKVYETMKPRDAAAIFNELDMPVMLAVIDRMKEAKASAILAAMIPDKARDVTTQLVQSRTKAAAAVDVNDKSAGSPGAGATPGSSKPAGSGT